MGNQENYLDEYEVANNTSSKLYALYAERDGYGDTLHRLADINEYHKSDFISTEIERFKRMYSEAATEIENIIMDFWDYSEQCDPLNQSWEQLDDCTIGMLHDNPAEFDGVYITDWDPIKYEARKKYKAAKKQAIKDAAWNRLNDKEQELYLFGEDDAATYAVDAKLEKLLREEEAKHND